MIKIDPTDVSIEIDTDKFGITANAIWRGRRVGYAWSLWVDEGKTRLLISDLNVEHSIQTRKKFLFWPERCANCRGLGIGGRLLQTVIGEARILGALEIYGKVVQRDLEARAYLLDWYSRLGFEIGPPDPTDWVPHICQIKMRLDGALEFPERSPEAERKFPEGVGDHYGSGAPKIRKDANAEDDDCN